MGGRTSNWRGFMKRYFRSSTYCLVALWTLVLSGCAEKADTPQDFLDVAHQHERTSQLPEAVAAYRKSLELDEKQPVAWYDLGVAYATMDKSPEAVDAFSRSIALDKNSARTFNNRAAAYATLKQFEKATEDCTRAIELDPDDFLAWRNRGLARHDLDDLQNAMTDYDESIRINGRAAETYLYRGNVLLDRRQWDRALEDLNQAVHLDPELGSAWLSRAIALARLGREADAESSRGTAKTHGAKIEDVIIADLLPDKTEAGVTQELHLHAVNFVKAELNKNNQIVDDATAPWDLSEKLNDRERRFLVRVLNSGGDETGVQFSAEDLTRIQMEEVATTLIVVQSTGLAPENNPPEIRIVKTIDDWTPDLSAMKPASWSLPVTFDPVAANSEPVASAQP